MGRATPQHRNGRPAATRNGRAPASRKGRARAPRGGSVRWSGAGGSSAAAALPARLLRAPAARAARARGSAVLDALVAGPAWIVLVGALLAGIVFFNVDLLQLNRDIAVTAERASALKRQNARLRLDVARLSVGQRIQELAGERGLVLPAPAEIRYLRARRSLDGRLASKGLVAPVLPQPVAAPAQPAPAAPAQQTPVASQPAAPATTPQPAQAPPQTAPATPQPPATPPQSTAQQGLAQAPPPAAPGR